MSYVRTLTICLLLVYFMSAAGCHCFDLIWCNPTTVLNTAPPPPPPVHNTSTKTQSWLIRFCDICTCKFLDFSIGEFRKLGAGKIWNVFRGFHFQVFRSEYGTNTKSRSWRVPPRFPSLPKALSFRPCPLKRIKWSNFVQLVVISYKPKFELIHQILPPKQTFPVWNCSYSFDKIRNHVYWTSRIEMETWSPSHHNMRFFFIQERTKRMKWKPYWVIFISFLRDDTSLNHFKGPQRPIWRLKDGEDHPGKNILKEGWAIIVNQDKTQVDDEGIAVLKLKTLVW